MGHGAIALRRPRVRRGHCRLRAHRRHLQDPLQLRSHSGDAGGTRGSCTCEPTGKHAQSLTCNKQTHYYDRATALDQYLAVAYFQKGVSNFLVGNFEEALANFNDTLLYLRGNRYIDYEQLGLKYKLHSCEALFNRGLCYIYLQEVEAGLGDLTFAAKEKATPEHDVIDEAIKEKAEVHPAVVRSLS